MYYCMFTILKCSSIVNKLLLKKCKCNPISFDFHFWNSSSKKFQVILKYQGSNLNFNRTVMDRYIYILRLVNSFGNAVQEITDCFPFRACYRQNSRNFFPFTQPIWYCYICCSSVLFSIISPLITQHHCWDQGSW